MNKRELVTAIAKDTGETQSTVVRILDSITGTIGAELNNGGDVSLTGFGKFSTKVRAERKGRNPQTGAEITIAEKTIAACKLSQTILN